MVHPKYVVQKSIESNKDSMVGSGKLFNARVFIQDLYALNNMKFYDLVKEDLNFKSGSKKLIMSDISDYTYYDLLRDTQEDIYHFKRKK
jgi:hypothetical protein